MEFINLIIEEFRLLILSAIPIIELRGAIPIGIATGLSPIHAIIVCYIGSILPAPFLIKFLKPVFAILKNQAFFKKIVDKLTNRTLSRVSNVKKISTYGLIFFVAVPLPTTGVWTASMAAALLNLDFKRSLISIAIGNAIAAVLVTLLTLSII